MMSSSLGSIMTYKFKESIYGIFYVLSDGGGGQDFPAEGHWMFVFTIAMLVVDALQVLRSMAVSKYAWTAYSISIMRSVDLVSLFLHTVEKVVPEWVFFIFAVLLAIAMLVSAGFVMKLFRAGQVKIIWPLRILRSMTSTIVTIFFTQTLELLIYPVRCIDPQEHLSVVMHGKGSPCEAWGLPELAISIPALLVAVAFVAFSLLVAFFGLTINPLCRHPLAMCSGRVEFLWTLFKVAAMLLVYMEAYISATACAVILFLLSIIMFYYHCSVLPFHNGPVNMVRGGIYLAMVTFCLANIVIQSFPDRQGLQFWFLGAIPVAFIIGGLAVWKIIASISRYIGVLRGQWDDKMIAEQSGHSHRGNRARRNSVISEATQMGGQTNERSMHEQFFDVKWAAKRRFPSGAIAHMASRILLERRSEEEMPFLMSLLTQCLKDHPSSFNLSMFHLLILRYVFKERSQATTQEKLSKLQSQTTAADNNYILFTVNKKTVQEGASDSLAAKGTISAMNMMEFDQRMEIALKAHRECTVALKSFWKFVAKKRRSKSHDAVDRAGKMTDELEKFSKAMHTAVLEYAWLYEKYPSSAALLHSYANFCDHVLNDSKRADSLRQQVAVLDTYEEEEFVEEEQDEKEKKGPAESEQPAGQDHVSFNETAKDGDRRAGDNRSVGASSDSETFRSQMHRYMQSWNHLIMQRDSDMLSGINFRIRCAIFFLVTLSLISFIVIDFVLFNDVALKTIRDIEETGKFRQLAATAPYELRSQMIESQRLSESLTLNEKEHHLAEYDRIHDELIETTRDMQRDHYLTFSKITTKKIQDFYDDPSLEINIPSASGWETVQQSFRHLGTDFARRIASAASASYAEHSNTNYKLSEISQEKQDISYVFENMIRYVLPAFDQAVGIYQKQMDSFGILSTALTTGAAGLTGFVVLVIAIDVLRARVKLLKRVNSNRLAIELALELPHTVAVKFYKYFSDLELDMAIMEDEDQEVRQRMALAEDDVKGGSSRPGSVGRRMSVDGSACNGYSKNNVDDKPRSSSMPAAFRQPLLDSELEGANDHPAVMGIDIRLNEAGSSDSPSPGMMSPQLTEDNLQRLITIQSKKGNLKGKGRASSPSSARRQTDSDEDLLVVKQKAQEDAEDSDGDEDEEEKNVKKKSKKKVPDSDNDSSSDDGNSSGVQFSKRSSDDDNSDGVQSSKRKGKGAGKKKKAPAPAPAEEESAKAKGKKKKNKKNKKKSKTADVEEEEEEEVASSAKSEPEHEAKKMRAKTKKALEKKVKVASEDEGKDDDSDAVGSEDEDEAAEEFARTASPPPRTKSAEEVREKWLNVGSDEIGEADGVEAAAGQEGISPVAKEKSLRFSASAKGLMEEAEAEAPKPKVFGGLMKFMGTAKDAKEKKEPQAEKKVKAPTDGHDDEHKDGEHAHDLELNTVDDGMHDALVSLQFAAQPWFNRWYVYLMALAILMVLCVMFSLYPARRIPIITNMAPSVNRAAERQSLARGCITLSRELVLRDGLSRMTWGEISGTLDFFIDKFEEVDKAVRLGNLDYDIVYGADHRSVEHNDFMYMLGCPWREDPSDCTLPNNTYTRAAEDGLFNLQSVFLTSLKTVLRRYGSSRDEYVNTYDLKRDNLEDASEFDKIYPNQAAYDLLLSDPDLRFLDLMFAGDLFQGLDKIVDMFEAETRALLDDVHVEVRLLFGIYIGFLLQVFYSALFLRTLNAARLEVSKAKEYAHTLPLHVLDGDQAATVKRFYMRSNGQDEEPEAHMSEDDC